MSAVTLVSFEAHMPSAYFFRRAIHEAMTNGIMAPIALQAVRELENYAEQLRAAGVEPVSRFILTTEVEAKRLDGYVTAQREPVAEERFTA